MGENCWLNCGRNTRQDESDEDTFEKKEKGSLKMETDERLAVARKLMLISEMNPNFVADKRLWRWLGYMHWTRQTLNSSLLRPAPRSFDERVLSQTT